MSVQPILTAALRTEQDVVNARQRARTLAAMLGFDRQDQTRIATAVSEIARNTVTYGRGGTLRFSLEGQGDERALVASFVDQGAGIAGLSEILEGNYVSPTGMGVGIVGTRRLMDTFEIDSGPGRGTRVRFSKFLPRGRSEVDIRQLTAGLTTAMPSSLAEEVQVQNRDLLSTLADLEEARGELEQINTELEDTNRGVVALYAELDEQAEQLRRADELKSAFLSNMSHEFRTPLNSILALSRLLLDRVDGAAHAPSRISRSRFIRNSAESLPELVNDLLDLAKVEAGKIELRPDASSTSPSCSARCAACCARCSAATGVELVVRGSRPSACRCCTDEAKLSQILRNLISNALKFTEQGEVRVSVSTPTGGRIDVRGARHRHRHRRRRTSSASSRSSRRSRTRCRANQGHRARPAAVAQARGAAGRVDCRRQYAGRRLDLHAGYSGGLAGRGGEAEQGRDRETKILIVDDEESTRYVLRQGLAAEPNWTILEATDGIEGLRLAQAETPDFIVLDLNMPGLDGFEVFRTLKGDPATRDIPILVVTSALLTAEV